MGIPFYFVSIIKKHKGIVSPIRVKLEPDIFAIDFNCLIHNYIDNKNPVTSVVNALEKIVSETSGYRKFMYIAMDGVVPYAKIVQQRYRRFRKQEDCDFDRHQISPGTPYMKELAAAVRTRFPYAILSDTDMPGEGEHKIFEWLKTLKKEDRRSICIYGLDADLILLSLAQRHLSMPRSFWLLRENQTFHSSDESQGFSILNVGAIELDLPIEQYIMLSVMCFGNDFVPNIGLFSLRENGYSRAIEIYHEAGDPNLLTAEGRRQFFKVAEKYELNFYREKVLERGHAFERAVVVPDGSHFERRYNLHVQDGVEDTRNVVECYWRIVNWTYDYFTQNTNTNWQFYYSYPEAPLISQIIQYEEPTFEKQASKPWTTVKQLQFILPKKSLHSAKKRCLYPDELYDEEKDTRHPWLRKYKWEAEPRISLPSEDLTTVEFFQS